MFFPCLNIALLSTLPLLLAFFLKNLKNLSDYSLEKFYNDATSLILLTSTVSKFSIFTQHAIADLNHN
ncbi:hypothetical protein CRE_20112 [Caenorhabditis remanei]|uniref:Serpentine receptor class gamma n=1 Tax=Caenorhabditis remanei TaxID=31234 RepID=E3NP60_CAERE|nr:hypothetical protein CRE_20112 [Caenorhabditis remanei]